MSSFLLLLFFFVVVVFVVVVFVVVVVAVVVVVVVVLRISQCALGYFSSEFLMNIEESEHGISVPIL